MPGPERDAALFRGAGLTKREIRNIAASVHQRLLNKAHEDGRPFQELLQYYAIERFLYRLSKSTYSDRFILKGALMLAVWKAPVCRPTKDIDLLGDMDNDIGAIVRIVKEICGQESGPDGVVFDVSTVEGERIVEDAEYEGVRIGVRGSLDTAGITIRLDIGFGDAVSPRPEKVEYPTILGHPAPLIRSYTRESAIAEKFHAMVKFGEINSRMKDFYDIWYLSREYDFEGKKLAAAIKKTFEKRDTVIPGKPAAFSEEFAKDAAKRTQWKAFVRKNKVAAAPADFSEVVDGLKHFLGAPVKQLSKGAAFEKRWIKPGPWRA